MSIYTVFYDLNTCLEEHGIDSTTVAFVLPHDGFEAMRASVTRENPSDPGWDKSYAFHYAGIWFLDGEIYHCAKPDLH